MTRRTATGFARLLPVLLVSGALVIAVAAVLAACGGGNGGSPQPTATVTVTASPGSPLNVQYDPATKTWQDVVDAINASASPSAACRRPRCRRQRR